MTRFIGSGPGSVAKNGVCNMCHNDQMTYTRTPTVTSGPDIAPPVISDRTPAHGAATIAVDADLTFTLSDIGSGVDWTTFSIQLAGNGGYAETYTDADIAVVSVTGTPASYDVTVNPDVDFGASEMISVTVSVDDLAIPANSMVSPAWSFTTATGAGATLTLHPSDVVSSGGFAPTNGLWADVLDTNDGDGSHVSACCGGPGAAFYVDMDDTSGLAGATINSITFYVYARYLDGPWPGGIPIIGNVNIGYETGTATVWKGNTATDASGNYNLIMSATYTADSDGGALDLADLDALQIAVQRNIAGPPQLRVTEVYAEIDYTP
jgi:hypothetical protein